MGGLLPHPRTHGLLSPPSWFKAASECYCPSSICPDSCSHSGARTPTTPGPHVLLTSLSIELLLPVPQCHALHPELAHWHPVSGPAYPPWPMCWHLPVLLINAAPLDAVSAVSVVAPPLAFFVGLTPLLLVGTKSSVSATCSLPQSKIPPCMAIASPSAHVAFTTADAAVSSATGSAATPSTTDAAAASSVPAVASPSSCPCLSVTAQGCATHSRDVA